MRGFLKKSIYISYEQLIGKQADQVATKELSATGNVGGSVNALSSLNNKLATQLADQQKLAATSANAVQLQTANFSGNSSAVSSYLQMLAM